MRYKMIVTDMDDTLLNSEGKISKADKEAIMWAQERGVKFVLASGRPSFAMKDAAKELDLSKYESYTLSYNGAIITDWGKDAVILNESLNEEDVHALYDFSRRHGVHIITYSEDSVISETESQYIDVEINLTGMKHEKVECFKTATKGSRVKCIMLEEPGYLKEVEGKLKAEMGDRFSIAISKPFFLEVTKLGMDKGSSLLKLADRLGIKAEEIIAVGDSYNDMSMLKAAGTAVAVENAKPEIKEMADYITTSNNEAGMAKLIERFIDTY